MIDFADLQDHFFRLVEQDSQYQIDYLADLRADHPQLAEKLEDMLANGTRADAFFEQSLTPRRQLAASILDLEEGEPPQPDRIGPYQVVDRLGQGGMAVVYLAAQEPPLERYIAIKVLHTRPGLSSAAIQTSLEREIQTLAKLEHPNIPKVFDTGISESGGPYFAMEYIDGMPLTRYCDHLRLDVKARIRLLVEICDIVSHCHAKGVIHGDLKPSNILVGLAGGERKRPIPRVIDFGIARALESAADAAHLDVRHERPVGSLAYMAPEQVEMGAVADVRNDVFSLGVILHELLVGVTPIDFKELAMAVDPIAAVREQHHRDPVKRLADMEEAEMVTKLRQTTLCQLSRMLQEELAALIGKVIQPSMHQRYQTVEAFRRDLQRYLDERPIEAKAHYPLGLRLRKAWRRDPPRFLAFASLGVLTLALFCAIAVGLVFTRRAERQTAKALDDSRLMARFYEKILTQAHPFEAGPQIPFLDVLERGEAYWEQYASQRPDLDLKVYRILGVTYLEIGALSHAEEHLERALSLTEEIHGPDSAETALALMLKARCYRETNIDLAIDLLERAQAMGARHLASSDPHRYHIATSLAAAYIKKERFADAVPLARRAVSGLTAIHGEEHLETLQAMMILGTALSERHLLDEAVPLLQRTLDVQLRVLGPNHPERLTTMQNLGNAYLNKREFAQAETLLREAASRRAVMVPDHPGVQQARHGIARALIELSRFEEARLIAEEVVAVQRRVLGEEAPDTLTARDTLASIYGHMEQFEQAVDQYAALWAHHLASGTITDPSGLRVLNNLGHFLMEVAYYEDAGNVLMEALRLKLSRFHPWDVTVLNTWVTFAENAQRQGDLQLSESIFAMVLTTYLSHHQSHDKSCFVFQYYLGHNFLAQDRYAEAESLLVDCWRGLGEHDYYGRLAGKDLAECYQSWDMPELARPFLRFREPAK